MGERLGVGYIGLGDHSRSHVPFLNAIPLCETIGVADLQDVDLGSITNFTDNPVGTYRDESGDKRLRAVRDYHKLLEDDRVDGVVVITRDDTHYRIAEEAIEAGKHVLVEKPAAANLAELAALPALFDLAETSERILWVCHPREFGDGPWSEAAQLIGNPEQLSTKFGVGSIGRLLELRHDCHYTIPSKQGVHTSFADDKLNHTIVSVLRSLPNVTGFRRATLHDNDEAHFDASLVTVSEDATQNEVIVKAGGRRCANAENHGGGVWRDWIEAVFEEGTLRVEPTLGRIALMYGKDEREPIKFEPAKLYDNMFGAFNTAWARCALDGRIPEPLTRRTMLLGTAAAILMQQPGFDGNINEDAVQQLEVA